MKPKSDIYSRLKEARMLAGLSQAQAAEKMGMHRPTISEIEAGRRNINSDELQEFSKLYGVGVSWLLGQEDAIDEPLLLAARELSKIKGDDLDRLLRVITIVRSSRKQ